MDRPQIINLMVVMSILLVVAIGMIAVLLVRRPSHSRHEELVPLVRQQAADARAEAASLLADAERRRLEAEELARAERAELRELRASQEKREARLAELQDRLSGELASIQARTDRLRQRQDDLVSAETELKAQH